MKKFQKLKNSAAVRIIASKHGKTAEEISREMEKALEAAWMTEDPAMKELQEKLFPEGKPSAAEFIRTVAAYIKKQ